jgi:class 3 adenylate cyclase/predicted ATPase
LDIDAWLRGIGLAQYAEMFRANDIDIELLGRLTNDDLKDIGVVSFGHRKKLLEAIAELAGAVPVSPQPALIERKTLDTAERRQVTVMFSDLVGSTAISACMDPEDLREVISAYQQCVTEIVHRFGGFVAKYVGDGVLVYFGYPEAHEDDAERAVRTGLAIAAAVGSLPAPNRLEVRIGIATGLVVVGDLLGSGASQERNVIGETPNLAARLQALAEPNAVIIADSTRRQVGALFGMRDLGPQALRGFPERQRAWRILGDSGVESRFAAFRTGGTALVGREEELELLQRRWAQAKSGEGRVVLLSGEPGIGKSRLTETLLERLSAEEPALMRYFCSPHHQDSALHPVISQLERVAGFKRDDSRGAKRDKLAALLSDGASGKDDLPLFAELLQVPGEASATVLELPPQRKKELTFEALLRRLEALARRRKVLMVFEDLHWIDPTTRELLDRSIAMVERLPILLIATFRPEFQAPWTGQPHVTMLTLSRLARSSGAALVRQLLADAAPLPAGVVEEIIERTDGVPLFLEEMTKVVLEAAVSGAAPGTIAMPRGGQLSVPPTLQASLMARLDRLGPASREAAQTGAAIGRDFSYELVAAASLRNEAETAEALDRLVASGLVFQRGVPPTAEYQFKHALVQDTAYGSLLRGARQGLHGRIAGAIRARSPELAERSPEILAHHLTEAGELDSAAAYWLEAGRRAVRQSANVEAAAHLARGIAALGGLPQAPERDRQELALQLVLGPALLSNRGFSNPDAKAAYQRAAELAERLDDDRARFAASWGLWITEASSTGSFEILRRHLDALIEISERINDPELILQAHHSAWATYVRSGELTRTISHIRGGLALYDPEKHRHHALTYGGHDPGVCGKGFNALVLWALGYPDQAAASASEGIALAEALGHMPSLLHSLWFAGAFHCVRRDSIAARDCGERLLELGREHKLVQYRETGAILHGWAVADLGDREKGLAELRSAIATYGEITSFMLDLFSALLTEAELAANNFEEAAAVEKVDNIKLVWWRPELLRLRGELQRSAPNGDRAAAESSYLEAIAAAKGQEARSLELRAATGLARLWRDEGRRAEAHALLGPIYGWFTEGFDTLDLKEAKALLDVLHA